MNQNIGLTDKIIRILVALAAAVLGYYISPWFYLLTVIALITVITGFCGFYSLLGITTNKPKPMQKLASPAKEQAVKVAVEKAPAAKKKKPAKKKKR